MLHVTMLCFLASYLVAFILELSRLVGRSAISRFVMIGFGVAGFLAHTMYLLNRSQQTHLPPLLASTHDWMLVLAWVLALCYLMLTLFQKDLAVGVFALPVVLLLVVSAYFLNRDPYAAVNAPHARRTWTLVHAALLVFGMTAAAAGFLSGIMYLVQHNRLKTRHAEHSGFRMPSLARLAQANRWSVILAFLLLTLGFASGVFLAVAPHAQASTVQLSDPAVITSGVVWLFLAGLFAKLLKRSGPTGRQVAWLTLWGCGFLLLTVVGLQVITGSIHSYSKNAAILPAGAHGMVRHDPCHVVWQVRKVPRLDPPAPQAPRPLPARPAGAEIVSLYVVWTSVHTYQYVWTQVHTTGFATAARTRRTALESETISELAGGMAQNVSCALPAGQESFVLEFDG